MSDTRSHNVRRADSQVAHHAPDHANTCAGIVTYFPDLDLASLVSSLANQVSLVVIVDNSADDSARCMIDEAILGHRNVHVIYNKQNLGLGVALNQVAEYACAASKSWVVLMDQDTIIEPYFFASFQTVYASMDDVSRLALIGSALWDKGVKTIRLQAKKQPGRVAVKASTVITSGSMLSLLAYKAIGPFRDDFFIDHIDTEYCMRATILGYVIMVSQLPAMHHSLGNPVPRRFIWRTVSPTNHDPLRRYYQARNACKILRLYWNRGGHKTMTLMFVYIVTTALKIALYEDRPWVKLKAMVLGLRDGLLNRSTDYPS